MMFKIIAVAALALTLISTGSGAVIGTNQPAWPLTDERVAARPAWQTYLSNSGCQRQADQDFLRAEMRAQGLKQALPAPVSASPKGTPLDRPAAWYGSPEARRIADCVVSFQTPAGGWGKHTDFAQHPRAAGESFVSDSNSRLVITNDLDAPGNWSYVGTFDNGATTTELRFLAKVIAASGTNSDASSGAWQAAFTRGLDYVFAAQFPNGGWPQVWPLQGGYHDAVTFNDDAMLNVVQLLRAVAAGGGEFAFVPPALRARAEAGWRRGLDCILAAQITVAGRRTVWGQQHDALTLQPVSARNYEMPSQASAESGTLVLFLMQLPEPDARVVAAVHAAAAWFQQTEIKGKAFRVVGTESRKLVDAPGSGPIWARYYEIGTDRPIYGDRDRTIHDDVNEISRERRKGYSWFTDTAKRVLQHYEKWSRAHPLPAH